MVGRVLLISFLVLVGISNPQLASAGVNVWSGNGPEGGTINALVLDPVTPATVYAATAGGGVFKSVNGGGSWSAVNTGLDHRMVYSLAIDPVTPEILYAGTALGGVYKSIDSGESWSPASSGLAAMFIQSLALDPAAPTTLYAGTSSGVFKSVDSGGNWSAMNNGLTSTSVQDLAIDPATPATVYAGTSGGGAFKSTDGGANWSAINTGLPGGTVLGLAIDPVTPATLYAGTGGSGVYKSTDGGANWSVANTGQTEPAVNDLTINPATPATVYAATSGGVFKSTDAGANWSPVNSGHDSVESRYVAIDPVTPATTYSATSNGVFKSTDGGGSWAAAKAGLIATDVRALAINPATSATLYAGVFGGGVHKSTDGGGSWSAANSGLGGYYVQALAIEPASPDTIYAGTSASGGLYRSTDGGASWSEASSGLTSPYVLALAIDPAAPATVYAGTWGGAFKSTDGGGSWNEINTGLDANSVHALAIDPATPATLYAGTGGSGVYKSTDGGANWSAANTGMIGANVHALAIDPLTTSTLYAGTDDGVYKSTDGGGNWSEVNAGLDSNSVHALAIDPATPATVYAGTYFEGTFRSVDGGENWFALNAGLENLTVGALAIDPVMPEKLYAGTGGGGVYSYARQGTCTVNSTADSGPGTLRACLESALAGDTITFDPDVFPPEAPATIAVTSEPLPEIWQGDLTLDGTEAGVILDGSALSEGIGLHITSSGNVVQGLQVLYFPEHGIVLEGGAIDNLIGGSNTAVGGACSGECNLISGSGFDGIWMSGDSGGNTVSGNYIGTDASGTSAIPNGYYGVDVFSGYNLIGGSNASPGGACTGECNLISGNTYGLQAYKSDNTIVGNYIGTDASGTIVLGGGFMQIGGSYNRVGGATEDERNVTGMIFIAPPNPAPTHNSIVGNHIGVDASGTGCFDGGYMGILVYGSDHIIGGDTPEEGNLICGKDHMGISIPGSGNTVTRNRIFRMQEEGIAIGGSGNVVAHNEIWDNGTEGIHVSGSLALTNTLTENSIHANGGLGIDLEEGGNTELPAPVLTAFDMAAGTVSGTACPDCTVEVFSDDEDEGQWYEATVIVDGSGAWSFAKGGPFTATHVTATATDLDGNTSEFSGVSDIAVVGAMPIGPVTVGEPTAVRAELFNAGYQPEDAVPVTCRIEDPATAIVYEEAVSSGEVPAGTWAWVAFPDWAPSAEGEHTLTCQSALPLDQDPANDLDAHSVTATAGPRPDVWTRDNDADTGDVPTDPPWWVSPDVWVRHQPDGGLVHQNPVAFAQNTVYVRLRNRGDAAASGTVDIYASRSRLGWPCHVEAPNVGTIAFADLAPGEVRFVSLTWTPEEMGHHGLQTVIDAVDDPPDWAQPCSPHRPRYDNNISWKNVVVYAHPPTGVQALLTAEGAEVQIVNLYGQAKDVDLVLDWTDFPAGGSLVVTLPQDLFDRWEAYAGRWVQGMEVVSATQEFVVTSPVSATIGGLPMQADEVATATLTFDGWAGAEVQVNLQERIDGSIVGGVTYWWLIEDDVPPEVLATSPADGEPDVPLDTPLVITFNEPVGPLSLDLALAPDPDGWQVAWNEAGTEVTATHSGLEPGTTYQAAVTASDAWGNAIVAPEAWSFSTEQDEYLIYLPLLYRGHH
jgi:photosystem II stability/assembly factor-like uncharacterized protein